MDVMIVDMDWHYTYKDMQKRLGNDVFGERRGWTGYSWNRELFPDPEGFLHDLHAMGYKMTTMARKVMYSARKAICMPEMRARWGMKATAPASLTA